MHRTLRLALAALLLGSAGLAAIALLMVLGSGKEPAFRVTATQPQTDQAPYSVTMSPMGTVRFDRVPQRIVTQDANYNDILFSIGQDKKLSATGYASNFYDGFYAQLKGVSPAVDRQRLIYLSGASGALFDKELLYRLHADIHHIDPVQLAASRGWSPSDVQEIARNVGPFFANRYSREDNYPGKEPYSYYSLWELSEKVAQVYRRPEPIARLKRIYDQLVRDVEARLPPVDKRPRVGLVFYGNGRFTPYSLSRSGFGQAQYRVLGARDAFEKIQASTYGSGGGAGTALDLEGLLAIDPEVIIVPFAIYPATASGSTSRTSYEQLLKLKDNPLGQRLTALQHGRVYPGGTPLQGPVFLLFQIEMAAKQIYPDLFGSYRDDQSYPPTEQLFDRAAVAAALKDENQ